MIVGGALFKKLGYITFDIDNAKDWALAHMIALRDVRSDTAYTPEDYLSQFILSLQGHIQVTNYTDRGLEAPIDAFPIRGEIKARMAVKGREFYATVSAFDNWCRDHNLQASTLRKQLTEAGFIIPAAERMALTRNTSTPSARQRVIAFDYDKIQVTEVGKDMTARVVSIK
jgi:hypothetical protein